MRRRGGQDAAAICKKVSDRYKALDTFQIEGSYEVASRRVNGPSATTGTNGKFSVESAARGLKRRVEYKSPNFSMVLVTDGSIIWTYLPAEKSYTRVEAAATNAADDGEASDPSNQTMAETLYASLTQHFVQMEQFAKQTDLAGEQELKLVDGKRRCWVLVTRFSNQIEKNWVDEESLLVRKTEEDIRHGDVETKVDVLAKKFSLEKPDASAFTFEARGRDKQVDELNIPGMAPSFVGKRAADFTLKDLNGERVTLADLRGKVVVLDFWATWCPPCRHELPSINKLAGDFKEKNVVFLGINDEGSGTVKGFNKKYNYTFTTLEDAGGKVHRAYLATAIPNVFVIGKDGTIVRHFIGSREEADLAAAIQAAGAK